MRTNGLGLPVAIVLTGGETSDVRGYAPLMAEPGPAPSVLMGDKGYDADAILADLDARGVAAVIPSKRNRTVMPFSSASTCMSDAFSFNPAPSKNVRTSVVVFFSINVCKDRKSVTSASTLAKSSS